MCARRLVPAVALAALCAAAAGADERAVEGLAVEGLAADAYGLAAHAAPQSVLDHAPSRLFEHFDADSDGLLSEKEVAALLKQLKGKRRDEEMARTALRHAPGEGTRQAGLHDVTIDGETLSVGDGDFDLLFKQLSNLKQTKDPSKDPRMTLQEDIVFVKDLVIVFFAATIGGVCATHLGQPALIGFLLGGMTVGPGGLGVVTELVEVETLASLGIAFLLFCLGIEFSITELNSVRRVVVVGGTVSMMLIVLGTGVLSVSLNLVTGVSEAIALGLAVSLSSTAVVLQCLPADAGAPSHTTDKAAIARAAAAIPTVSTVSSSTARSPAAPRRQPVGDGAVGATSVNGANGTARMVRSSSFVTQEGAPTRKDPASGDASPSNGTLDDTAVMLYPSEVDGKGKLDAEAGAGASFDSARSRKIMLGLLVFQDVMIGLILALLPTLQGTISQFVEELLSASLRLGCFVVLSLILSEFVLPVLADRVDKTRSQEVFTVSCVVFCLAMAYLSERMGLAIELGAFAAGIMLSESRHKVRVEESVEGIRTMFSAVFFISVGMMIHWRYFYQNFMKMILLLFVVLFTKAAVFSCVILALGSLPLKTAMACGAAIAQAGEFTFVVASKGQALLLFSSSEARMINGATALSMLLSPYIISFGRKWASSRTSRGSAMSG